MGGRGCHRSPASITTNPLTSAPAPGQSVAPQPLSLRSRLMVQPEAIKLGRLVGQRFFAPGREVATLTGSLTIGAQQHNVRFVRTQQDDGEHVGGALDTGATTLTWMPQTERCHRVNRRQGPSDR